MALEKIVIVEVAEIIKKLLPILDEHIGSVAWGIRGDLEKLKLSLVTIQAAVSDAEINQVNDEAAILWLRRLKFYDADDVMDHYSYEYMHRDEEGSQLKHKVRDFVSFSSSNPLLFRFRLAGKIRAINKALDEIHKEYTRYHPEYCSQVNKFSLDKCLRILYPFGLWDTKFSFPSSKFKHLTFLDLSNCEFDLSHDLSLYHSHNLQTLILHSCSNVSGFLGGIGHLKKLRLLDVSRSDIKVLPHDLIIKLTNVQTLDFNGCRKLEALPENIGLLKRLSSLNLSYSSIRKIPDSITCINNLMTFNFMLCWKLDALPRELGALTRLRCLVLRCPAGTGIKVLPESCISNLYNLEIVDFGNNCELPKEIKNWPKLREFRHSRDYYAVMPGGIEKLTCLETLDSYIVRKEADIQLCGSSGNSGIEELAVLNSLQRLYIKRLENFRGGIEAAERAKLKDTENLRELYLEWSFRRNDEDEEHDDMVLEGLLPYPNLRTLQLQGFFG